jgi:hypothetical protein
MSTLSIMRPLIGVRVIPVNRKRRVLRRLQQEKDHETYAICCRRRPAQ